MVSFQPSLYRIETPPPGQISIMARPRGGEWLDDEMHALRRAGVDVLVSLLTLTEAAELGLAGEPAAAARAGLDFHALPIPDFGVPDTGTAAPVLRTLHRQLTDGRHVVIHCRAGIGRSSTIAAACLTRLGTDSATAWQAITAARGVPVPETDEQRQWPDNA